MSINWTSTLFPVAGIQERGLVRSRRAYACDRLVTAHEHVLWLHAQIRERGSVHVEELLDAFLAGLQSRHFLVLDEILRKQLAKPVDISSVDSFVQALHRGRMIHQVLRSR